MFYIVEDALDVRMCQNWFARFKGGNLDLNDIERPEIPVEAYDSISEEILEEDPMRSTSELVLELSVTQTTFCYRLRELGKAQKVGKWVPHNLSEINIAQRLSTCVFSSPDRIK